MDATQIIVNAQNIERKKFITKIKDSLTQKLLAQHKWSSLIEQLSHERAAWHFRQSYPQNWELDPTEGPLRIRRRLRRFHLNIKARFLLPEYRQKLDCRQLNPPLSYLHQSKYEANESNILKDKVHADEQICYNCCCYLVTPSKETLGEILIGEKSVYFVAENFLFQSVDADILCLAWLIKDITEILPRRYELQDSALEIFLTSGITYLIAFKSVNIREEFYLHIKKCQHFTPHTVTSLSTLTNQWRMHSLTNFEYLMQLNKLAGRSCNDLMQYPVFPFIIANYSSSDLNLEDPSIFRVLHRLDFLVKQVSENAMDATQIIVNAQNIERKKFITKIKDSLTQKLLAQHKWSSLIEQLSHERAAWHFRQSYPQNWELDPTEGPLRIRRRLRRFHLNIKARFLLPEYRQKLDCRQLNPPLSYLHQSKYEANESNILKDKVHADEQICYNCCCYLVTPSKETLGEILIGEKSVYFVAENFLFQSVDADILCLAWLIKDITEILPRRYELQDSALEIFLTSGITYLIAFKSVNIREEFYLHIKKCQHFTPHTVTSLSTLTNQWRMHSLTNFEYLMQLNKLAGRSCNDLMQYPVFPFIIANYSSSDLNLEDPSIFRNLSRPVAIQNKAREQHYINAYNYLKAECETMSNIDSSLPISGPYHYGSHYSNSGTVLHFLVRLPPFTEVFLAYQDDNFDIPDRTFHSLDSSWRLSSGDSTSDVKELIPEFYFLPEFLLNSEGFDFGIRQTGERVHHVALPPWCHDDPRLFILIHRQALESDFVTGQLQNWIDLIFGYKQTGKAAVEAINVFHPVTYYGHDITKITDPVKRCGLQTMIKTVGQTPRQLFFAPHPMVELSISLGNEQPSLQTVLPNIQNLKWGSYVGSPSSLEPLLVWRCNCSSPICKLVPLMTNDVFGLTTRSCLLLNHRKSKAAGLTSNTYVMSTALVSWGYGDGIIRMTLQKDRPTIPLFTEFNDPVSSNFKDKYSGNL
ncbi:lysosomal-trafficking regulator-like [Centruroides sculpturatus]|uniref:lysosomal-trafficking regulator-like n=1 Tax=Centruroides sculpturatus TaxID=218467 RepID=UPI000C6DDF46|nr:lysosomal-trafficking regulator-like [Centruroides sculpturatus]